MLTIPKKQNLANFPGKESYTAATGENNLYILFNDDPDNLDKIQADDRAQYLSDINMGRSILALITINETGDISKTQMMSYKNDNFLLSPKKMKLIRPGEYLIYGSSKKGHINGKAFFK